VLRVFLLVELIAVIYGGLEVQNKTKQTNKKVISQKQNGHLLKYFCVRVIAAFSVFVFSEMLR